MIHPLPNGDKRVQSEFLTNATGGAPDGICAAIGTLLASDGSGDTFLGDPAKGLVVYTPYLFVRYAAGADELSEQNETIARVIYSTSSREMVGKIGRHKPFSKPKVELGKSRF
ncbi:hypothetical protein ACVW1A_007482 [Bradyrhizobium sp. LB1.3]